MSSQPEPVSNQTLASVVSIAFVLALVLNVLPPNAFSSTVMLFDYEFGLMRRGLTGAIFNLFWGETVSKSEIFVASASMTFFGAVAVYLLARKWLFQSTKTLYLAIVLFASFAFAGILASTGYLDMMLIGLVGLAFLSDPTGSFGLGLRCLVCFGGLFVHEVMLPYFVVFLAFDVWLARRNGGCKAPYLSTLLVLACGFVAFAILVVWGEMPVDQVQNFRDFIQAKSEFNADKDALDVLGKVLHDNLAMMEDKRSHTGYRAWVVFDGIPLFLMTLWVLWFNLRIAAENLDGITRFFLICAIVAPLSLNVIAFDVVRFGCISVLVGFFVIVSQIRANPETIGRINTVMTVPMLLMLLVVNLNTRVYQLNTGEGEVYGFPWIVLKQLEWFQ
ncbi:MAG: hypothetical protein GY947_16865 [Rhodobacteraceae bacterium]|nr:hypothetical protein [Paracoccaceae bacterium]